MKCPNFDSEISGILIFFADLSSLFFTNHCKKDKNSKNSMQCNQTS